MRGIKLLSILLLLCLAQSCVAVSSVKPWEKGTLAESTMAPGGLGFDNKLLSHVYTSKETAKGGEGVAGGGCGCN